MRLLLFLTPLLFTFVSSAQFDTSYYPNDKWIRQKHFDSLIRKELKGELSECYFVITYPILAGTTSWVPQFIKIFNKIKSSKNDIVVVFYNNGGLRVKDVPVFMHDLFKLSYEEIKKIKCIYSDELYDVITEKRNLVRVQYYFRRKLYYNDAEKWHKLNTDRLPTEKVSIYQSGKIKLTNIDSLLLFERDAVFPYKKDYLLILSDSRNIVYELNTKTGMVATVLNISNKYSAHEIYCKYFANYDTAKCNLAKKNESVYTNINRKVFRLLSVNYIGDKLIIPMIVEAVAKDDKDFNFTNDEGDKKSIKAKTPTLQAFSLILHYDLKTKDIQFYPIVEQDTGDIHTYLLPEHGLFFKGDSIISSLHNWYPQRKTTYGLVKLVPRNNNYYPNQNILPTEKESGLIAPGYSTKSFFYYFNDQWYLTKNYSEEINLIGRNQVQERFYGNGHRPYPVENYAKFLEDTAKWEINFLFHDVKPIFNNKLLLSYATFKDQPTFEIKNRMLKTVDIIDATSIKGMHRYFTCKFREDLLIDDNMIYYKSLENGEMYLNVFTISLLNY